ncbi:MAG: hypothetical protein ACD_78C00128G0003 [uncultured bacterium (gcode 4)]|uniref:Lipoprotein n=1 Tax=uncultured bacterium (gcode 4) TaxID=1234023 RepID=K1YD81_9BACT|nr:MAG: hypothetical protein ACD_78C00128G0003 [uncultured bacterium (gcode 4)]
MKKPLLAIFLAIFLTSSLSSCFWNKEETKHDVLYYKNLWKETFRSYQAAVTKIPKKGKFDFELGTMVSGDGKALSEFGGMKFQEKFSSMSIGFLGDYNFEDEEHPSMDATVKVYLNKRSFGAGDIDITFRIDGSGAVAYSLNHLDRATLEFFGAPKDLTDSLMLAYDENKGKLISSDARAEFLKEIFATLVVSKKNSPLRENSKEEEGKIIDAFLDTEVLEIIGGVEKEEDIATLTLKLNPDNVVTFLNRVATILGGDEAKKEFDGNKDFLSSFTIAGTMDIQDKKIIDSRILSEIPLSSIDVKTGEKIYDALVTENKFMYANPERFDVDITTLISTKNTPDNKLQLHFRWLIK